VHLFALLASCGEGISIFFFCSSCKEMIPSSSLLASSRHRSHSLCELTLRSFAALVPLYLVLFHGSHGRRYGPVSVFFLKIFYTISMKFIRSKQTLAIQVFTS
jgi:hypothetical protein